MSIIDIFIEVTKVIISPIISIFIIITTITFYTELIGNVPAKFEMKGVKFEADLVEAMTFALTPESQSIK